MSEQFAQVQAELAARGYDRMVLDRSRIEALLDLLGSPQRAYPAIHITGTNGKTSTAWMVDCLLQAHGLRTGCYTTPYLDSVRETIAINGEPVDEERFVDVYREVAPVARFVDGRDGAQPVTYFEMTTAMALASFSDAPVDVAVVEVGLGGAEDATNVLQALTCVLTSVGLDHTEWLGATVAQIAANKAGIVHSGATLVCAEQPADALHAVQRHCADIGAKLLLAGRDFGVRERVLAVGGQVLSMHGLGGAYDDLYLPLHGAHQAGNAALALAAVESFLAGGSSPAGGPTRQLNQQLVREGFARVSSPGRLERVGSSPLVLLDAAHNPAGMVVTVAAVREEFSFEHLVVVLGFLTDKDAAGMLALLEPIAGVVVCTASRSGRSLPAAALAEVATGIVGAARVRVEPELVDAVELAVALAGDLSPADRSRSAVLVTGSVTTVAQARAVLLGPPPG